METSLIHSTICLAIGLGLSLLMKRHSALAHRCLFLSIVAALVIPLLYRTVGYLDWGLIEQAPEVTSRAAPVNLNPTPSTPPQANNLNTAPLPITSEQTAIASLPEPQTKILDIPKLLTWTCTGVAFACCLGLVAAMVHSWIIVRQAGSVANETINQALATARDRLNIQNAVSLRTHSKIRTPSIWCWQREPVLLIPTESPKEDIDWTSIFCHELAHYKRRDHLTGLFGAILVCICPWHPLAWIAKRRLTNLSEQACDDWVLNCGQSDTDYAESLLRCIPRRQFLCAPSMATTSKGLRTRVHRLLEGHTSTPIIGRQWSLVILVLAVTLCLGISLAQTRSAKLQPVNETLITVRLLDAEGTPARHFPITESVTYRRFVTNEQGEIKYPSSFPMPRYLYAFDPERKLAACIRIKTNSNAIEAQLKPADILRGHVVDTEGKPVINATVENVMMSACTRTDREGCFVLGFVARPKPNPTTSMPKASGQFVLPDPNREKPIHPRDKLIIRDIQGNRAVVSDNIGPNRELLITAKPAMSIRGTLVNSKGIAVSWKEQAVFRTGADGGTIAIQLHTTDSTGQFTLPCLPLGDKYRILFSGIDQGHQLRHIVELDQSNIKAGTIDLGKLKPSKDKEKPPIESPQSQQPYSLLRAQSHSPVRPPALSKNEFAKAKVKAKPSTITIRLLNPDGTPASHFPITESHTLRRFVTDKDGTIAYIDNQTFTKGFYLYAFDPARSLAANFPIGMILEKNRYTEKYQGFIEAKLQTAVIVKGKVVDTQGRPVANADVQNIVSTVFTRTDLEGRFLLGFAPLPIKDLPSPHSARDPHWEKPIHPRDQLLIRDTLGNRAAMTNNIGEQREFHITLEPAMKLEGTFVNETGQTISPWHGRHEMAVFRTVENYFTFLNIRLQLTNKPGHFVLPALPVCDGYRIAVMSVIDDHEYKHVIELKHPDIKTGTVDLGNLKLRETPLHKPPQKEVSTKAPASTANHGVELEKITPLDFLTYLTICNSTDPHMYSHQAPRGWVKKEHLPLLFELIDSKTKCPLPVSAISSPHIDMGKGSTIGCEAALMIKSFRTHEYPAPLGAPGSPISDVDKAELRAWWEKFQKKNN